MIKRKHIRMILLMAALAPLFVDASENNAMESNMQDSAYLPEKPTVDPREIFQVFKVEPPQEELKVNKYKYVCPHCPHSTNHKMHSIEHARTHSGAKPYRCDWQDCIKAFARSSSLKRHKYIHTETTRFACPKCKQTFAQLGNLNTHIKNKHPKKIIKKESE